MRSAFVVSLPPARQSFRRTYADAPAATSSATPKAKKRFRFFRLAWRVTYLSFIGGLAYLTYIIYEANNPADQFEPDPSKKTLVILGKSTEAFKP
jgi:NADH:ubiquinone reductase (non-electrogenic)